MTCADVEAMAAELALGLVGGPERAAALDHIEGCPRCRAMVDELAAASDELLLLAPSAEPAAGFEQRVLARLQPSRAVLGRPRRPLQVVGAVAAAVALLLAGVGVGRINRGSSLIEATMRTASGRVVGDAYLHEGDPPWVFVAVPGWSDGPAGGQRPEYTVRLTLADGRTSDLAGGDLDGGKGAWGSALDVSPRDVRAVALVGEDGTVWCSGEV
jgi:hypothetical protein